MKNFRDIERLSSYLDGQLSPAESAQLETRISSDPELASALDDLRAARGILRKLPARKAPRNFTLTRQMVGLKPPLPRSYSVFQFSTAFATFLLVLTFAANAVLPRISFGAAASAPVAQELNSSCNGCGGGGAPAATQAPAATEAPLAAAPSSAMGVAPTEMPAGTSADSTREIGTPTAEASTPKQPLTESVPQNQSQVKNETVVPVIWQFVLLVLGLASGLMMFLLRRSATQKWK